MPTMLTRRGNIILHPEKSGGTSFCRALVGLGFAKQIHPEHLPILAFDQHSLHGREVLSLVRNPWRWYGSINRWYSRASAHPDHRGVYTRAVNSTDDAPVIRAMLDQHRHNVVNGQVPDAHDVSLYTWVHSRIYLCPHPEGTAPTYPDHVAGPWGGTLPATSVEDYLARVGVTVALDTDRITTHAAEAMNEIGEGLTPRECDRLQEELRFNRMLNTGGGDDLRVHDHLDIRERVAERDAVICEVYGYEWGVRGPTPARQPVTRLREPLRCEMDGRCIKVGRNTREAIEWASQPRHAKEREDGTMQLLPRMED